MKQWALKKLGHYVSEEVKHVRNVSFKIYLIGNLTLANSFDTKFWYIYNESIKLGRAHLFFSEPFSESVTDLYKYPTALTKQARRACLEYALNCHVTTV